MTYYLRRVALVAGIGVMGASAASAASVTLQPDEATSKDVLVYAFNVPFPPFGFPTAPNVTNLDAETLNALPPAVDPDTGEETGLPALFGALLGSAETDPFVLIPGDGPRFHTTRSLIEFDLSGVTLDNELAKATLTLRTQGSLGAFDSPSEEFPVTADIMQVLGSWEETEVTWETRPAVADTVVASAIQDFAEGTLEFDITSLVRTWLADPSSNFGLQVSQREVVEIPQPDGMRERYAAGLYASSAFEDPSMRPSLELAPVPVPAAALLLGGGLAMLAGFGRLRKRA